MEEFPEEATDEKAELVANRLYDQVMYENKVVAWKELDEIKVSDLGIRL